MALGSPISRRLLLGRLGSGTGVIGTFLLPGWMGQALAASPVPAQGSRQPAPNRLDVRPASAAGDAGPRPWRQGSGAIGISGTYEKQVVAGHGVRTEAATGGQGRYRVALTRTRDAFVPLDERVAKAQAHGAALFVSMHADALSDHAVRGASVYTLANTASDAQTAALAQRENSADRFGRRRLATRRPRWPASWPAWCGEETRIGSGRLARTWSAISIRTCRCCRTRSGMPASSC